MASPKQHSQGERSYARLIGYYALRLIGAGLLIAGLLLGTARLSILPSAGQASLPTPTTLTPISSTSLELELPPIAIPTLHTEPQPAASESAPVLPAGFDDYRHPQGWFEILSEMSDPVQAAQGTTWRIAQEEEDALMLVDAQGQMTFTVQVVNTGYALDQAAWTRFIAAHEQSSADLAALEQPGERIAIIAGNAITVTIVSPVDLGAIQAVSVYQQADHLLAITELVLSPDVCLADPEWINQQMNAVHFHPENVAGQPAYARVAQVADPLEQIRSAVPEGWLSQQTSGPFTWVANYYSPDQHAVIQLLTYDDGKLISGAVAGNLALFLLNNYLSTEIMVTEDRLLPGGLEQLRWHSPRYAANYAGISSFRSLGTTFVMQTVMYDIDYAALYLPVLAHALESLSVSVQAPGLGE